MSNHSAILQKRIALATILLPSLFFLLAIILGWFNHVTLSELLLFVLMFSISTLGITAGYHRCLSHKSFKAHPVVKRLLLIAGSMAAQGPVLFWVSTHRLHHHKSDTSGDPHSPNLNNSNNKNRIKGFWYAHIGWMLQHYYNDWPKFVPDLLKDRLVMAVNMQYFFWLAVGIIFPGIINCFFYGSLQGFWPGVLWGGLLRIFFVHHTTWSINSICHRYGRRDFLTNDSSTNNYLCGLLAFGEGFHNNHHAFPYSAKHGLLPKQLDITYLFIRCLEKMHWVWDVKLPKVDSIKLKRIHISSSL